jgi:ribonuclease P protein component
VLDRSHRLTTSAGFTAAVRQGRRAGTRTLVLHLGAGPEADPGPRVGFVVSKAVGNAVTRNRVKRRLRHLARERLTSLPSCGVLVVRALPAAADAAYDVLGADLDAAFQRLERPARPARSQGAS